MRWNARKVRDLTRRGTRVVCKRNGGGVVRGTVQKATGTDRFDVVTVIFDEEAYNSHNDGPCRTRMLYVDALMKCLVE